MLKRNRTPPVCTITRTKHARLRRSGYSYYVAAWDLTREVAGSWLIK